jgi:hypothetical protein
MVQWERNGGVGEECRNRRGMKEYEKIERSRRGMDKWRRSRQQAAKEPRISREGGQK